MKSQSIYNKFICGILMLFIAALIVTSFLCSENRFFITKEILFCLVLLVILSLAELFDHLSIPKVLSLSKDVKEVKKENDELKQLNLKLVEQIISVKNSNSQVMYLGSLATTGSSSIEDVEKKKTDEIENNEESTTNENVESETSAEINDVSVNKGKEFIYNRVFYRRYLEFYILKKLFGNRNNSDNVQFDVKVVNNKPMQDNIMKTDVRFDALEIIGKNCTFYEIKVLPEFSNYLYELHFMLKMVKIYGEINDCFSKLVLVFPKLDDLLIDNKFSYNRLEGLKGKIYEKFSPAIEDGLLEILEVEVTKEELDEYIKSKKNKE